MGVKISICIPTYEQYGVGDRYLNELLISIQNQTFKDFNIIISDHSVDDKIKDLLEKYKNILNIKYIKNLENRGNSPSNTNVAIKNADGDIIKIMFQDDLFCSNKSLEIINDKFNDPKCEWVMNSHYIYFMSNNYNVKRTPSWHNNVVLGDNTLGMPSALSFRNKKEENFLFDEKLIMMMDCEYYYRLFLKYGLPTIVNETITSHRIHNKQISSMYDNKNFMNEINYIKEKFLI